MKSKQVKKILSITLASAMIASGVPTGPLAISAESENQGTEAGSGSTEGNGVGNTNGGSESGNGSTEGNGSGNASGGSESGNGSTEGNGSGNASGGSESGNGSTEGNGSGNANGGSESGNGSTEGNGSGNTNGGSGSGNGNTEGNGSGNTNGGSESGNGSTEGSGNENGSTGSGEESNEITLNWGKTKFEWNGKKQVPSAGNGYTYTYKDEKGNAVEEPTEVGKYTVTATATAEGKTITNPTCDFEITKKSVKIDWKNTETQKYTGTSYDLPTATFKNVEGNEEEIEVKSTDSSKLYAGKAINAGSYTVETKLTEDQAKHYEFDSTSATLTITPAEVAFNWDDVKTTYNGTAQEISAPTSTEYDGTDVTVVYSTEDGKAPTDAGTYTAEVKIANTNYVPTETTKTRNLVIEKLDANITIGETGVTYGVNGYNAQPTNYGVTDANGTALSEELQNEFKNEFGTNILTCNMGEGNVGEYAIKVAENAPTESKNFVLKNKDTAEGKLTVNQLPVTISIADQSKYYGEVKKLEYTLTPAGGFNSGDLCISLENALGEDILQCDEGDGNVLDAEGNQAKYPITLKNVAEGNFKLVDANGGAQDLSAVTGNLTINPLPVTVEIPNAEKVYGDADPEFDINVTPNAGITLKEGLDVKTEVKGKVKVIRTEGEKAGKYTTSLSDIAAATNYTINNQDVTGTFEIKAAGIVVTAVAEKVVYGQKPVLDYTVASADENKTLSADEIATIKAELGTDFLECNGVNVGKYDIVQKGTSDNYAISYVGAELTIEQLPVIVKAKENHKTYGDSDPKHLDYEVSVKDAYKDLTKYNDGNVKDELENVTVANGQEILKRAEGEDVTEAGYAYDLAAAGTDYGNFVLTYDTDCKETFKINPLAVTITADAKEKFYGAEDPELTYQVTLPEGAGKKEEDVRKAFDATKGEETLKRAGAAEENGNPEDVGSYDITLNKKLNNYKITYVGAQLVIKKLPVTIVPEEKQSKIFGAANPKHYGYSIKYSKKETKTQLEKDQIIEELKKDVLVRDAGEDLGSYAYHLNGNEAYVKNNFKNYDLTLEAGSYTINAVAITAVDAINSRQDTFKVATNLKGAREDGVSTKIKVTAEFPDSKGITFTENIDDYISDATNGVLFTSDSEELYVNTIEYQKKGKNKKDLTWNGKLPAGTKLTIDIVDANGSSVSEAPVEVTVDKVNASFAWSGTKQSSLGNGDSGVNSYVDEKTSLTLAVGEGSVADEMVEVVYNNGSGKEEASYYNTLNQTFKPSANNGNAKHLTQTVTANIVDTLNIACDSKTQTFYVDDQAFPISSSAIQFENRGKEIKIQVPEGGTIKSVTIPGGTITLSGNVSNQFTLPVSFSGKNLIPTGSNISVTYVDEAGHEGTGNGTVSRSSVNTPITFRIRPELNANGYLNGQRGNTLIVSGVACACEPIRVTVAGMTQTINATQADTWSDSNGAWEVAFDMSRLPEGQDFTISAEYMDVNGTSYSMNAKYEAFVAPATVKSPVYEAMTHISGMVEPGTAVALVVNGETSKYYEIDVDRFGRMSMDDVPMMFGGEDSFDIYVQDIAGNVSIQHYDIAEPGDPFEVTSQISPLGKYFYRAEQKLSDVYAATPISAKDFEESDTLELPLIMGMSYEVGKLTVAKSDTGIVVTSDIQLSENIDAEDYRVENEKLYVYRTRPTVDDLRDKKGEEFKYGDTIPLGENETIWIVDEKDMTILADDMEELELFNYEESKEYETYQEQ